MRRFEKGGGDKLWCVGGHCPFGAWDVELKVMVSSTLKSYWWHLKPLFWDLEPWKSSKKLCLNMHKTNETHSKTIAKTHLRKHKPL
jgi:hypothetical protein